MPRLILVPQYPVHLRYQEWFYTEFPKQYRKYFNKVIVLGGQDRKAVTVTDQSTFSPHELAAEFEAEQIAAYLRLELAQDDVLLLCDISYPGLFASVLWHKRPSRAFAICHASARNHFDLFAPIRKPKFATESAHAGLFDAVFVASNYHAEKLRRYGWNNVEVHPLPYPPFWRKKQNSYRQRRPRKDQLIVVPSRLGIQKRTVFKERAVQKALGIKRLGIGPVRSWDEYYERLFRCECLLTTAKEETFGYQIVDAVISQIIPFAPRRFSYPELLTEDYLYDDVDDLIFMLKTRAGLEPPKLLVHDKMLKFYSNTAHRMMTKC
jgi:hypothetical protein